MSKKDITQKNYFDDNIRFADFMNAVCFHGRQIVKPEELESVPTAVLKADRQAGMERLCDVVKKQTRDGTVYAVYVMENQETVDYGMLVRIMTEESLLYDKQRKEIIKRNRKSLQIDEQSDENRQSKESSLTDGEYLSGFHKTDRLTPVYTTVIYWGDEEWDGATSLRELRDYMNTHKNEVEKLDDESKFFLSTMLGQKKLGNELLKQNTAKTEERSMCKAIDDLIEDGREEGRAEARAEAEKTIQRQKQDIEELRKQLAAFQ